ncbi:MAG: hypothetical protein NZ524_00425 [Thiobacillaceae bacterium]|nr:hypothetical protein [Thiobacillaceae bacterium]MCX7673259.1 hypothetical protein [Thiobacillaceae bacterium]MDW8323994.1 hypothetical protein [Burkholderiales bacterium]
MHLRAGMLACLAALLVQSFGALACDAGVSEGTDRPAVGCSVYMTPAECHAHQRILGMLYDRRERYAYLSMYTMLIAERQALCGAPSDRTTARYAFTSR